MQQRSRVVLISGCSTGIGRSLALKFAASGCTVVATARNVESIKSLKDAGIPHLLPLDVNDIKSIKTCVDSVLTQCGRIDVLVNNAGINTFGPLLELPLEEVQRMFNTNVIGLVALTQAVVPCMIERRSGCIVNVSSIAGYVGFPYSAPYSATKAAVSRISETLRFELAPFGINVVDVQPGGVVSEIANTGSKELERYRTGYWGAFYAGIVKRAGASQVKATPSDVFASHVVSKVIQSNPPNEVVFGKNAVFYWLVVNLFPKFLVFWIIRRTFGLNQQAPSPTVKKQN